MMMSKTIGFFALWDDENNYFGFHDNQQTWAWALIKQLIFEVSNYPNKIEILKIDYISPVKLFMHEPHCNCKVNFALQMCGTWKDKRMDTQMLLYSNTVRLSW